MDDPVYDGGRHLVVAEDVAPAGEAQVRREDHRLGLVGLADHLEEQARAVGVQGQEPELVDHEQAGPADLGELPVEPAVVAGAPQPHDERGGGEEARLDLPLAAFGAQRRGHVGLARPDVAHEHQVLAPVHERQGQQVLAPEALRPRHARPVVAVEVCSVK